MHKIITLRHIEYKKTLLKDKLSFNVKFSQDKYYVLCFMSKGKNKYELNKFG